MFWLSGAPAAGARAWSPPVVLAAAGLVIGIPAAIAATKLVRSLLFGLQPGDPLALIAAAAIMAAVAVLAGYLPARRASRMDPLVALRYE